MPRHGKNAALSVSGNLLSGYLDSVDLNIEVDTAETDTFGATWKSSIAGLVGAKVDFGGLYDPTATTGPGAVIWAAIAGGVPVTALYYPGGNVSGQTLWTITSGFLVKSYTETSAVKDVVKFKGSAIIVVLPVRTVI